MPEGLKIFDADGSMFFETGAHVLDHVPGFKEKIGEVTSAWSVAEGYLGCCYAILLKTEPDDALKKLGMQGTAQMMENAKKVAKETLTGDDLTTLMDLLDKLNTAGKERNRVQHDLWSRRAGDDLTLYAVHVDDYRRLFLEFLKNAKNYDQAAAADRSIDAANKYAANASNAFSVERLEALRCEIELVSQRLREYFMRNVANG